MVIITALAYPTRISAGLVNVNVDPETIAAMTAAYGSEAAIEASNSDLTNELFSHYLSAEVASAGIFSSKWLDHKAMQDLGLFPNAEENYYYKHIYQIVVLQIMPKLLDVGALFIEHPEKAMYWGPYLMRTCEQVKQLCMQFESVVTDGKLSFKDVNFLEINDQFKTLFDLAKLGNVDWEKVLDHFSEFGDGLSKEDLLADLEQLISTGGNIASAGGSVFTDAWNNGSKIGNIFKMKPDEILSLYEEFSRMYDTFSDPANVVNAVKGRMGLNKGVAGLFKLSDYNIGEYFSDYVGEFKGQYYRQRWYIYYRNSGDELVCDYNPPFDSYSLANSSEWYRVEGRMNYNPSAYVIEASLANSERYAGWSRAQVAALNRNDKKYQYTFENYLIPYSVRDRWYGSTLMAYAHHIEVRRTWNIYEEVYEDYFDSQTMTESSMMAIFNAKLQELNTNDEGIVYVIGKGQKMYYQAADERRVKGMSSVSFRLECKDASDLAEGNFSWRENGKHNHGDVRDDTKRYAMETTLSGGPNTSEVDAEIDKWAKKITELESQIHNLEEANKKILAKIASSSIEESKQLRAQYNQNLNKINALRESLNEAKSKLSEYQNVREELVKEYANEKDGTERIPSVMHDLESAFGIIWQGSGSWQGNTFVRKGNVSNIQGVLTFTADLKVERGESRFLGIRIHRAQIAVHWKLKADYSSSSIVDIMELDPNMSDRDKANKVNTRMRQIMNDNPGCTVECEYAQSAPPQVDDTETTMHLLWTSDRLKVAREVDYRLSKIYAQLIQVEKYIINTNTINDIIKKGVAIILDPQAGRAMIGGKSYRRWRRSATAAANGEKAADVVAEEKKNEKKGK